MGLRLTSYVPYFVYGIFWIVLIVAIISPKIGFYFLAVAIHFPQTKGKVADLPLGSVFIEVLLLITIISLIINGKEKNSGFPAKISISTILIIHIVYSFFSLIIGTFSLGSGFPFDLNDNRFGQWVNYITIFLMFFLSYHLLDPDKDVKYVLVIIFGLIAIFSFRFFSQFKYVSSEHFLDKNRVGDVLGKLGANEMGAFFASYSMLPMGMFLRDENKLRRLLYAFIVFFGLYGVIYSYSRGAYVGFLLGTLFLLWKEKRKLLIPLAVALLLWKSVLPVSVVERIEMTVSTQNYGGEGSNVTLEHSAASRIEFADAGLDMFYQSPLVGKGLFTFNRLNPYQMDAHNVYIKTLAETGVVGIIILILILCSLIFTGYKSYTSVDDPIWKGIAIGFLACVIVFVVGNFFGDRWSHTPLTASLFIMLGLLKRKLSCHISRSELTDSIGVSI